MLQEIYVENFALIDKVRIKLKAGLNAISGETGAGKSVIIDAVSVMIGGRAGDHFLRAGAERYLAEGVFTPPYPGDAAALLSEAGFDQNDDLVISREVSDKGKSSCRVNARAVSLSFLKDLGRLLINIHGQSEHTLLLEEARQLALLDSFGGEELALAAKQVRESYTRLVSHLARIGEISDKSAEREERREFLEYKIAEIKKIAPVLGEDEDLERELNLLTHSDAIKQAAEDAYSLLTRSSGTLDNLSRAVSSLKGAAHLDERAAAFAEALENAYFSLEDLGGELAAYKAGFFVDDYKLEEITARLSELNRLKKKYGGSLAAALAFATAAEEELGELVDSDLLLAEVKSKAEAERNIFESRCRDLTELRTRAADALSSSINRELAALFMPDAVFKAELFPVDSGAKGAERTVFMISANKGERPQPVAKIASGGELSRIILAIKVVLSSLDAVPVLIFDEVDAGLGGGAISAVAERLRRVADEAQVICVTHSAVLTAAAGNHLRIYKEISGGRTVILTEPLGFEARIKELSRMIAGDLISETTYFQAREMLRQFGQTGD